jgi:vacuolar-type H+-ATPase subunit I/STV1
MARFNITLPNFIADKLAEDAARQKMPRSTLIAQHIEQHYEGRSAADFEEEIREVRAETAEIVQRVRSEFDKRMQTLVAEHEAEKQQMKADCERRLEEVAAENAASIQQFENELEQLETVTKNLDQDLKASEQRNASAVEKFRQLEVSKNTIVAGLQHEAELLQQKISNLETLLHVERQISSELRHDKVSVLKQLELVTLRLPAPQVGFWTRLFGVSRREKKES